MSWGIVAIREMLLPRGSRGCFVSLFAKSAKADLAENAMAKFNEGVKSVLALLDEQVVELLNGGDFVKIKL